jgi:trimethylamine-N-oxide reductase (cytochrome c)
MKRTVVRTILYGLTHVLRHTAKKHAGFREFMCKHNCTVQIRLKDGSIGRFYVFKNGKIRSDAGIHATPDVVMMFKDLPTALSFLKPPQDMRDIVHAAKQFRVVILGRDDLAVWFMQLLNRIETSKLEFGVAMPDGTVRYTTNTNGGPAFVYVKDGRIVRTGLIEFDAKDAPSWTLRARGKVFTPWRKATVSPHMLTLKSQVYSDRRVLYPMKRVDFDPNGERNTHNRGKSGYVRISWDEALDLVANEIKRQRRKYGPGCMAIQHPSHHQWGNVGYYLSALLRFGNLLGFTRVHHNPDSWEGWYWGAQHHYGNSMRVGIAANYGTVEDCLKECEMIVFWSSDPESTNGVYAGFEGTQRRFWARELGIEFVHIDPHLNPTAQVFGGKWIPIRPGTDPALAAAIMHVWVTEGLYDKEYVSKRTTGFDAWRDYLLGKEDGVPKTPEWQEPETGVPAAIVRALARAWGGKKTYLAAGGMGTGLGGACRNGAGSQWPRAMIYMMAMQGWGKPGVNMGNLQAGTPLDNTFYFPHYAEGGISGELAFTASAINNYVRMPHVLTMNPVKQVIPRQRFPEAIIEGRASGHMWDGSSLESQFTAFQYPMPGYSRVHMLYRYGASAMGTICDSSRFVEAYRHPSLEFIVGQGIYMESEMQMADVILPACTTVERWDISEWAGCGGYVHHATLQLNHRVITLQHKCIEPLGESKSDYQIFLELLSRFGKGALFSEGCSELDWCKRQFDSSDLPRYISWEEFVKKGYYVLPPEAEELRDPVNMRWYAEDRHKDVPEPHPLPADFGEDMGKGLQTQSGKIEFVSSSILRGDPDNPERPALNRYIPARDGLADKERSARYPLLLTSTHSRYSFHTYSDGKDTPINDIEDHRVLIDGRYYWVVRMHPRDARERGIRHHDLIRVFNDRSAVICAANVSPMMMPGVAKTFEASAEYVPARDDKGFVDLGGCINLLTPKRAQAKNTSGMSSSSCLVEIERWTSVSSVMLERARA